jgi:hypothetical protein
MKDYITVDGQKTALDNLNGSIESAILSAGLSFQNEAAFTNMVGLVKITMASEQVEVYRAAFPEVRMDQDGNSTPPTPPSGPNPTHIQTDCPASCGAFYFRA